MMLRSLAITLLLFTFTPATVPAAGIFKWVDKNGKTHFGDRPPADVTRPDEVKIRDIPEVDRQVPSDAERRARQNLMLRNFELEREQKKALAAKDKVKKKKLARQCVIAKRRLEKYQKAGYLYGLDDLGNKVIRSDAERAQATKKIETTINKNCK
ncbi:MAG: hypothetical protein ACI8W7_004002 [Gammaproteobacteria bacterium]|jgi:hypothetical protein